MQPRHTYLDKSWISLFSGNVIPNHHASSSLEYRCACETATMGISILGMFRCASMYACKWWRGPLHCSVKAWQEWFVSNLSAATCGVLL